MRARYLGSGASIPVMAVSKREALLPVGLDIEAQAAMGDIQLLRTDRDGWIELSTDGEQLWVEVERK